MIERVHMRPRWSRALSVAGALGVLLFASTAPATPAIEEEPEERAPVQIPKRSGPVLSLAEVLDSIEQHDPRLESAEQAIRGAEGRLKAAQGEYDPSIRLRGLYNFPFSYGNLDARVEQQTPLWGISAWAGYQLGYGVRPAPGGNFPVSNFDLPFGFDDGTSRWSKASPESQWGALMGGINVPIWRDGLIDRRRADIRQAKFGRELASDARDQAQLRLEGDAATVYWQWVASGLRLDIENALLELALTRNHWIERRIELGILDALVLVENRRLILDRQGRVVAAQRAFQQTGFALSMYLRDAEGNPNIPAYDRAPNRLPPMVVPPESIDGEIEAALERRPDKRVLQAEREQAKVELRFAKNQRAPKVDLVGFVIRRLGASPDPDYDYDRPTSAVAGVVVELPAALRTVRGQLQEANATLGSLSANLRLLNDQIAVEIRDGHSALVAGHRRAQLASQEMETARTLATAENRKFKLGSSDLILVNLRELAAAEAATTAVTAVADYFIAKADLEVALGLGVQPVPP